MSDPSLQPQAPAPAGCDRSIAAPPPGGAERIFSIDAFRVAAILAVICLHTLPFQSKAFAGEYWRTTAGAINQLARFAVPFFFLASGFFFGRKLRQGACPRTMMAQYAGRLLVPFAAWSMVYLVVPANLVQVMRYGVLRNTYWKLAQAWANPVNFAFEGFSDHLWFLTALACGLAMLTVFRRRVEALAVLASLFYLLHVFNNSYHPMVTDRVLPFNARNGPGVGTLFVLIGYLLSSPRVKCSIGAAVAIFFGGMSMHLAEAFLLERFYNVPLDANDYLLGTIPWAAGALLVCLARPQWGKSLAPLGAFTLGIYLVHPLLVRLMRPIGNALGSCWWEIVLPFVVYGLSLAVVSGMMRAKRLRKLVI